VVRGEDGEELVEFAISAFVLCLFVFGVIELCLVLFSFNTAAEAARDTARWLSVNGTSCVASADNCGAAITARVHAFPGAALMTPTVTWCTSATSCSATPTSLNAAAGDLVQVQVQYTYLTVPFVTNQPLTVTSTAQMVIWQ
jgi:Flp pilus assembly protein TadG